MGQSESQLHCDFLHPGYWVYFPRSIVSIKYSWNFPVQGGGGGYTRPVLVKMLLTDKGEKIVYDYQFDIDAEKIYPKLSAHELKFTNALINSYKLLTYIKSARVVDGYWHSTTKIFIIKWQDHIQIYETLVDSSCHLSGVQKLTM